MADEADGAPDGLPNILITSVRPARLPLVWDGVRRLDDAGFPRVGVAGFGGVLTAAASILERTASLRAVTCVQPTILMHSLEAGRTAANLHAVYGDRFALGLGVSHAPFLKTASLAALSPSLSRPIGHIREFVAEVRSAGYEGAVHLAAVGPRMMALAGEVASGLIFAHVPRSDVARRLEEAGVADRGAGFEVAGVLVTAVDEDLRAARDAARARLTSTYVRMPNYRRSWRQAGYGSVVDQLESALDRGDDAGLVAALSDEFIDDECLVATPADLPSRIAAWREVGVDDPILHLAGQEAGGGRDLDAVMSALGR